MQLAFVSWDALACSRPVGLPVVPNRKLEKKEKKTRCRIYAQICLPG